MKFVIELKGRTLSVVADRVKIIEGKIMLFNVDFVSIPGTPWKHESESLVGSFGQYNNFYITGDLND